MYLTAVQADLDHLPRYRQLPRVWTKCIEKDVIHYLCSDLTDHYCFEMRNERRRFEFKDIVGFGCCVTVKDTVRVPLLFVDRRVNEFFVVNRMVTELRRHAISLGKRLIVTARPWDRALIHLLQQVQLSPDATGRRAEYLKVREYVVMNQRYIEIEQKPI